ncbi:MAG TPA: hypothetical protein VGR98_01115 [Streptosporangiaceae bacterium]|nr:hypothetical protein [Streptosporangiaceae bacterium]
MSEIDELRATVDMLAARVGALADQVGDHAAGRPVRARRRQRLGRGRGGVVDRDGTFDAVPRLRMRGDERVRPGLRPAQGNMTVGRAAMRPGGVPATSSWALS